MYGTLELDIAEADFRFSIGLRSAHDKSMRLAMTVGYKVFCCDNGAFSGDFEPVLAKHSQHFNLVQAVSVGVDQMQRNFKPMVERVNRWRDSQLTDAAAKLVIYRAFVEAELDIPHHLDRIVHSGRPRSSAISSRESSDLCPQRRRLHLNLTKPRLRSGALHLACRRHTDVPNVPVRLVSSTHTKDVIGSHFSLWFFSGGVYNPTQ
jgi:hypothetical protein